MSMVSVTIVGAGSHFTMGLLGDFFRVGLEDARLVLMDIDEARLKTIYRVVRKVLEKRKFNLKVEACTDLRNAIEGADYVITTIRTGGTEGLKSYIEIPLKYNAVHIVGDTTGPGCVFKALLEAPSIISVAEAVKDLSPNAMLLNFTNPMTTLCMTAYMATGVRTVGLCHGINHIINLASKLLNIDPNTLEPVAAGINHFTWTTGVFYKKENLLPKLYSELFNPDKYEIVKNHPYLIGRQLFKVFKVAPTLSDRHTCEFFHQLYTWINHPEIGSILKKCSGYVDFERRKLLETVLERTEEWYREMKEIEVGKRDVVPHKEFALDIISAIENGKTEFLPAVNIPNNGLLKELPDKVFVEVPGIVSKSGVHSLRVELPSSVLALLNLHSTKFVLLAKGIVEKDLTLIEEALNLDPLTPSPELGHKMLNEFIKCWKKHLEQYGFKITI